MNDQAPVKTEQAVLAQDPEMHVIALFDNAVISKDKAIEMLMEMEFDYFEAEDFVANRGNV